MRNLWINGLTCIGALAQCSHRAVFVSTHWAVTMQFAPMFVHIFMHMSIHRPMKSSKGSNTKDANGLTAGFKGRKKDYLVEILTGGIYGTIWIEESIEHTIEHSIEHFIKHAIEHEKSHL